MMQDYIRTSTYQRAILANSIVDFRDKVVLDVGAGSGILSFFAVQAGARRVYAVEASSMARHCSVLVQANKMAGRIVVINGKIEEIELPEPVDVIISEPMGYMLYNERMLESYVHARKFFAPRHLRAGIQQSKHYEAPAFDETEEFYEENDKEDVDELEADDADAVSNSVEEECQDCTEKSIVGMSNHPKISLESYPAEPNKQETDTLRNRMSLQTEAGDEMLLEDRDSETPYKSSPTAERMSMERAEPDEMSPLPGDDTNGNCDNESNVKEHENVSNNNNCQGVEITGILPDKRAKIKTRPCSEQISFNMDSHLTVRSDEVRAAERKIDESEEPIKPIQSSEAPHKLLSGSRRNRHSKRKHRQNKFFEALQKPGLMFPTVAHLYVAPFSDEALFAEQQTKANFWYQQCFHGMDLSSLRQAALNEYFMQPVVDTFDIGICPAMPCVHKVDFRTVHEQDLAVIDIPLRFQIKTCSTVSLSALNIDLFRLHDNFNIVKYVFNLFLYGSMVLLFL
ncbi:unnamed protein product [Protopolystoma xenopodis]|uniref:type I protein arginine methyltransferase n=1 Tax=Protopolystoma xenopodis TaxID=117903 RepID=A0A3S5ABP4_9PLAT|nr:unnamed protein product [Protopolystoma xenopodis]